MGRVMKKMYRVSRGYERLGDDDDDYILREENSLISISGVGNMSTRKEIKAEIAVLERDAKTLRKSGDTQGARMAMKEIRKLKRRLKRLDSPNKTKPDKWL